MWILLFREILRYKVRLEHVIDTADALIHNPHLWKYAGDSTVDISVNKASDCTLQEQISDMDSTVQRTF